MDLPRIAAMASTFALLALLLLAGYWAITRARASAISTDGHDLTDELAELRVAYEAGQMSTEEFERVKASLTGRAAPFPGNKPPTSFGESSGETLPGGA